MNSAPSATEEESYGGGAELVTRDGRSLPLLSAVLRADAGGGLARLVLEQTFENKHDETLHVVYKMPLPADGAVSGYEFTIGQRVVKGKVEPKQRAREQFEQAIAEGRTAAILDQERADIFTQEIGNIPPGETIIARITVDQRLAWLPEGEWELRFPTVIGPRYIGTTDTAEDARAVGVQVASPGTMKARIHLEVAVHDEIVHDKARGRISSPSHSLTQLDKSVERPRESRVLLSALDGARLDRDIVLRWPVAKPDVGISLDVARPISTQATAHLAYGLVTIVPPHPSARVAALPRDLIVLIDTSGSMGGAPLDQAKKIVSLLVDSLGGEDRLELIEFSSRPRAWRKSPVNATPDMKKNAIGWVRGLSAGGATEMYSAIVEALSALRPGAQRQVVLVTDGYIGGEQKIVELLHERLPLDCRMHVVGVGSAVNRALATSLSRAGRGAEVLASLDEDAELAAKRLLNRTNRPVLTNVTIEGDAVIEVAPEHVPDVFAGAPVVLGVKLSSDGGTLTVRGQLANGGTWQQQLRVPVMKQGEGNQAIPALFAREHVADLEMRWTIGRETEMINRTIERVGTTFQIATRMTSWVAIDHVISVDPSSGSRRVVQPHELPYGTSMESFGLAGGGGLDQGEVDMSIVASPFPASAMSPAQFSFGAPPLGGAPPPAPPPMAMARPAMGAPEGKRREESMERFAKKAEAAPARAPSPTAGGGYGAPPPQQGPMMPGPSMDPQQQSALGAPKRRTSRLFLIVLFFLLLILGVIAYFLFR